MGLVKTLVAVTGSKSYHSLPVTADMTDMSNLTENVAGPQEEKRLICLYIQRKQ